MKFSAMRYIVMPVLFSGFALTSVVAQNGFCVMEWNVENLFDPVDNPMKEDDDFLPSAGVGGHGASSLTNWKTWARL